MNIGILGRQRRGGKSRFRRIDRQNQHEKNLVKQWTYLSDMLY